MSANYWSSATLVEAMKQAFQNDRALHQLAQPVFPKAPTSDQEPHAFIKEVLQDEGCLEIPLHEADEYISTEIHPVFRKANWQSLFPMDEAYDKMKLALALATKFITTDELVDFWVHLHFGKLIKDPRTGRRFLDHSPEENMPGAKAVVKKHLEILADVITFFWLPYHDPYDPSITQPQPTHKGAKAVCFPNFGHIVQLFNLHRKGICKDPVVVRQGEDLRAVREANEQLTHLQSKLVNADNPKDCTNSKAKKEFQMLRAKLSGTSLSESTLEECTSETLRASRVTSIIQPDGTVRSVSACQYPCIGVTLSYYFHLLSRAGASEASPCRNLRLQFDLASTLTHELAHAYVHLIRPTPKEPYVYRDDPMPEVGYAWENATFGAMIDNINRMERLDQFDNLPLASRTFEVGLGFPYIIRPLPMKWVESWFLKETWVDLRNGLPPTPMATGHPRLFIAERYVSFLHEWYVKLYVEGKEVQSKATESIVMSEPPADRNVEEWYAEVSKQEIQASIRDGHPESMFLGPRGHYDSNRELYDSPAPQSESTRRTGKTEGMAELKAADKKQRRWSLADKLKAMLKH